MEFEFAHLLDAVGAVQPHTAQLPAFQSSTSELRATALPQSAEAATIAPPQPSELGSQLQPLTSDAQSQPQPLVDESDLIDEINEVDALSSDGDLIGELLPWLDEEVAQAPPPPPLDELRSEPLDDDSIDSLLAELTETGQQPIVVVPPPDTGEPPTTNPLAMPKPAPVQSRVAETLPPPPPPPPPPVMDRVRESVPAEMPPPPPPAPALRSAEPAAAPVQVARVAPAPEPVVVDAEPTDALPVAARSRFADRGLSDDLLPRRDRRRRGKA